MEVIFNYIYFQNIITYSLLIFEVSSEHVTVLLEIHANLSGVVSLTLKEVDYKINYRVSLQRKA